MSLRIAALFGMALALLALGFLSAFNVPVDSEALVLRGGEVQRKVGPGIHVHIPLVEQVMTEPVLRERLFGFDDPFEIRGCRAAVTLIYRIGDLETYHATGGDLAPLRARHQDLVKAFDTVPDLSSFKETATPYDIRIAEHLTTLTGPVAGGLHINRVDVSLEEGCEPKRIVKQVPMARILAEPVGELAPERASTSATRATTADGAELQIEGFIATYRIADETRVENCFGRKRDLIAVRLGNLAERAAIDAVRSIPLDRLAELPQRLQAALLKNDLDQCGLALGAVDFSMATLARRSIVNCDETRDEACNPNTLVFPGFSAFLRP